MRNALDNMDSIALPFPEHNPEESASHIFPILLESAELRPAFMSHMKDSGIQTSIHYPPIQKFSAYKDNKHDDLTITELLCPCFRVLIRSRKRWWSALSELDCRTPVFCRGANS